MRTNSFAIMRARVLVDAPERRTLMRFVSRRGWELTLLAAAAVMVGESLSTAAGKEPVRLEEVGKKVTDDVGSVTKLSGTSTNGQFVVVLEENHALGAGQLEMALMLFRLHQDYQLRHVCLEGYSEGGTL